MDRAFDPPERPEPDLIRVNPDRPDPDAIASQDRRSFDLKGYRYDLSASAWATLGEVGRFRTIATDDLKRHGYEGEAQRFRNDLASLRNSGLLRELNAFTHRRDGKLNVLVLTKIGKKLLEEYAAPGQAYYAGFVKRAEVRHDAAIYRMYQAEAAQIQKSGGRIRRVVLDYELKKAVYRPLAKIRPKVTAAEYAQRQKEVAAQNRLKVVEGKILLPDLRIEFETAQGVSSSIDLELATDHYRGSAMRDKAAAGFKIYAGHESAARLAAAFDPEIVAEIFSF